MAVNLLSFASVLKTGGGILLAVLILLAMVTIHEFGHYIAGRLLGFKINEFAVGFGPAIFKKRSKKTGETFSLRLIPLGGYCAFDGEDDSQDAYGGYYKKLKEKQEEKKPFFHDYKIVGQVFRTYWIVEQGECLYLIDQHAAHERILYEELMNKFKEEKVISQRMLTPLMLNLTPMETEVLKDNKELLETFGFELEDFGGKFALRSTPYLLQNPSTVGFFTDILDRLAEERITNVYDTKILAVATMACKAAVKGHDVLSVREAEALIHQLLKLEHPFTCPHGRPTIVELTKYEMEKMFKRIQN